MRRREFITLLGGAAAAWPLAARAQQPERMRRIGVLVSRAENDAEMQQRLATLRPALEKLGWSEGRNIRIDARYAFGNPEQYRVFAQELVALQPDVIVAYSTPATAALQRVSRVIPIVFLSVSDPIGLDFVASLARPGGNNTGLLAYEEGITGKWLAMLKEIAPRLARAGIMGNPNNGPFDYFLRTAQSAASTLAIELVPMRVATAADIEHAIEPFARVPNGGLVLLPGVANNANLDPILTLAARNHLPAVYSGRLLVTAGGLMSYAPVVDQYREAATYIDRILRGAKAADLPVQAPVKYETVLNLKTAKALGLTVPDLLLVRADEVIE
jgi:putative ABC transport system substrate-binding protein